MGRSSGSETQLEAWLTALSIELLSDWDVFIFLHRHQTSLLGAEQIGYLVGHPTADVVAALDRLEATGLVQRSRVSQGVRIYQASIPEDKKRSTAIGRLTEIARNRAGRLQLAQKLRRSRTPVPKGGDSPLASGAQVRRR